MAPAFPIALFDGGVGHVGEFTPVITVETDAGVEDIPDLVFGGNGVGEDFAGQEDFIFAAGALARNQVAARLQDLVPFAFAGALVQRSVIGAPGAVFGQAAFDDEVIGVQEVVLVTGREVVVGVDAQADGHVVLDVHQVVHRFPVELDVVIDKILVGAAADFVHGVPGGIRVVLGADDDIGFQSAPVVEAAVDLDAESLAFFLRRIILVIDIVLVAGNGEEGGRHGQEGQILFHVVLCFYGSFYRSNNLGSLNKAAAYSVKV